MRPVWLLAINNLAGRRGRTLLLVIAMALASVLAITGVGMVSTVTASVDYYVGRLLGRSDLQVVHRYGGQLPIELLAEVRSWPEVEVASGWVEVGVSLTRPGQRQFVGAVARGIEPDIERKIHPPDLVEGDWPQAPGEVVMDNLLVDELGVELGDTLEAHVYDMEPQQFRIVGRLQRPRMGVTSLPVLTMLHEHVAQLAAGTPMLSSLHIKLRDSSREARLAAAAKYEDQLPGSAMFHTPASATAGINQGIRAMRLVLSILFMVTFMSAAFIVLTSLTTAVAQRTSELAAMRCIGGSRAQIALSQLLTGLFIAASGVLLGTPVGILCAYGLYRGFEEQLPGGFAVDGSRVVIASVAAMVAGLLGAAWPAFLASSVHPLEALRIRARKPAARQILYCTLIGVPITLVTPLLLASPLDTEKAFYMHMAIGLPLQFVGYFLLCVPLLVLLAWALSPLLARVFAMPTALLRGSVLSTPFRHGFTGGTLMISVALLVGVWSGTRGMMVGWFDELDMPDAFVASAFGRGLTDQQVADLLALDAVTAASPTAVVPVLTPGMQLGVEAIAPRSTWFFGFDPDAFFGMAELDWVQGNREDAVARLKQGTAVLISKEFHVAHGLKVGDAVALQTREGDVDFEVAGVVTSKGLDIAVHFFGLQGTYGEAAASTVFGTRGDARRYFDWPYSRIVLVELDPNVSDEEAIAVIRNLLPGAVADTSRRIRRFAEQSTQGMLSVATAIAIAALVIACFGVSNLIVAEVTSRRFEYGVLRAVGGQRALFGRLVAAQTLLMALTGCVIGCAAGIEFAHIDRTFYRRLSGLVYSVQTPWDVLLAGSAAAIAAAMLAALPTLWRLTREHPRVLLAARRM